MVTSFQLLGAVCIVQWHNEFNVFKRYHKTNTEQIPFSIDSLIHCSLHLDSNKIDGPTPIHIIIIIIIPTTNVN